MDWKLSIDNEQFSPGLNEASFGQLYPAFQW